MSEDTNRIKLLENNNFFLLFFSPINLSPSNGGGVFAVSQTRQSASQQALFKLNISFSSMNVHVHGIKRCAPAVKCCTPEQVHQCTPFACDRQQCARPNENGMKANNYNKYNNV